MPSVIAAVGMLAVITIIVCGNWLRVRFKLTMDQFVEGAHNERAAPGCVAWCLAWRSLGCWRSLLYHPSAQIKCLGGSTMLESGLTTWFLVQVSDRSY